MSQTKAQLLADSLGNASTGTVPIGGIILWKGDVASIPDGYALCNGDNGTPDLRNKFIENSKEESTFLDEIRKKYGDGELNPETGVFTKKS